ncbi:MAG: hypothetical protein Q9183_004057, partial [Haloplaca sp. 2 TL-2023]
MPFQLRTSIVLAGLVAAASASRLYISSYVGNITTLDLTSNGSQSHQLIKLDTTPGCSPNASWLQIDIRHRNLFCLDEGIISDNGSVHSYKIQNDKSGSLKHVGQAKLPLAPVHSEIVRGLNGSQLLAVAHYGWALTTHVVDPNTAAFTPKQKFNFTQAKPGPNAARQAAPHPHQVLADPTQKYLVVPDLGSDLLRIFYVNPTTLEVAERPSIPVAPGSGPRHGTFLTKVTSVADKAPKPSGFAQRITNIGKRHEGEAHAPPPKPCKTTSSTSSAQQLAPEMPRRDTYYYLVSELSSHLTSYQVTYLPNNGGLNFTLLRTTPTYGPTNSTVFSGNAPAEIIVAPTITGPQLLISNRNATFFPAIANPNPQNATQIKSDTLSTFMVTEGGEGGQQDVKFG